MIALAPLNLLCLFLLMFSGLFVSYGKSHDEGSNLLELKGSVGDIYRPSSIVPCGKQKISGNHHGHKHRSVVYNETSIISLAAAVIAILSIAGFLVYLAVYCCFRRRSQHMEPARTSSPIPQANEVTVFNDIGVPLTYEAIIQATDNFNRRNRIGRGGFGSIYKAEVAPGKIVAVKKLTASRHQGVPQFDAEVNILSSVNHPNLITLVGYYAFQDVMFLIYNYLPGGNLDQFIRARDRLPFNWDILHKIALDIASALSYLHEESIPRVLHRDIKPSNILLDDVYNAYLSDFGLAKMLPAGASSSITRVAGTYGYVAPEYASLGRVSNKADVYSYGVVLLELMSDKRVLDPLFSLREDGFNIVSWARVLRNERRVEEFFAASLLNMGPKDKLTGLLHVAVLCTAELASGRPTMRSVIQLLEQLQHLAG